MNAAAHPDISMEAFEAGEIDAGEFDHAAHIYVGWLYAERYPLAEAIDRFVTALRRLTVRLGVPDKYHETITWFFLLLIAERRESARAEGWFAFRCENQDIFAGGDTLRRYYSQDTLNSERARRTFVLPDRLTEQTA